MTNYKLKLYQKPVSVNIIRSVKTNLSRRRIFQKYMAVGPRFSLHYSALIHFSFHWETSPDETILEARNVHGNSNTTNQ